MKEKIIEKSNELFLNLGFKSVTMDEIASSLGVSKKTIYKYFKNKTDLVASVTEYIFNNISSGINQICSLNKNPIEEVFDIKRFIMSNLKDEKSSPQYQLQKYYPKIFASIRQKQFEIMQVCVIQNLNDGIQQGLYRKEIDVEFISRIYFNGMISIKDKELFPLQNYSMNTLMNYYLEYHIRGICTEKGLQQLENQLKQK
ncbi:TetR family transcriptional regulator [Polaribacter reichenbachii]|uniref:TetR family transcriptional regulator n=1 Tax=Polaribacter reichenbachii TaxID=996801 RepID=A0A1B8TTY0_9FLAO|nr:TetR/AcrR family transcriptional regulator [Polaribacter reichenbachii]APZ45748.1 TetR family transcriptional regulator [Polaribacter reichenbachii]AUC19610.1 TetR family transcriptional regulator [Polaribacter reichenbachii]OBY63236.1 TetR family transcriptional regulator [Polaribacter reichenbachii]